MLFWWADMQYDLYSTHGKVVLYSNGSPEGSCSGLYLIFDAVRIGLEG